MNPLWRLVVVIFLRGSDNVLGMFGGLGGMFGQCSGDVLEAFWAVLRCVLGMLWIMFWMPWGACWVDVLGGCLGVVCFLCSFEDDLDMVLASS